MPDEDKQTNPLQEVVNKLGNLPKLALFVNLVTAEVTPVLV